MSLIQLVDNNITDKNTTHSYLDLYEELLSSKKETAKNVLEIGIYSGGSIKLWNDYFINANVYGCDISRAPCFLNTLERVKCIQTNAYSQESVDFFKNQNIQFDFMLDDGPHTLESMKLFINLYVPLMKDDGIFIIEDVQAWEWIDVLVNEVPEELKKYIKTYDLRHVKGRYDDIVFTINKCK